MLTVLSPQRTALLIGLVFLATIVGAWIFEYAGYAPCDLCLKQRYAYYVLTPLAFVLAALNPKWIRVGLAFLCLGLTASAIFGIYHSGVEWKWWEGPQTCSGGAFNPDLTGELTLDLSKPSVPCDEAALRIPPVYGLSLAGWNAVISAALAGLALRSLLRK
jgi:disulfide bond formation protein DsbB